MLPFLSPFISFDGLSLAHCFLFCIFCGQNQKIQKNGLLRVSVCLWVIMLLFKALLQRRKYFVLHFLCIRQASITKHQVNWKSFITNTFKSDSAYNSDSRWVSHPSLIFMDQKSSLHMIAEASSKLEGLYKAHTKLQYWYSQFQFRNIPIYVFERYPSMGWYVVQALLLEM